MRRAFFLLGLLLSACSVPVTVNLPDQTLNLPALLDTQGKVVYSKDGLSFNPPPLDVVRGIRVDGTLETSQSLNTTLVFFARIGNPADDTNCSPFSNLYLCSPTSSDEQVGEASFTNSTRFPLVLTGNTLAEGLRQGRFWLGARVEGLPSAPLTLTFKNMRATVNVGF